MSKIIDFYLLDGTDSEGRDITQLWNETDRYLMESHDVIQWLFPLLEASMFNVDAPILTEDDIKLFHADQYLRNNLMTSFHRFLTVWGLGWDEEKFYEFKDVGIWDHLNHNWLRFTRVLRCLTLLGLGEVAKEFLVFIKGRVNIEEASGSIEYWQQAVIPQEEA